MYLAIRGRSRSPPPAESNAAFHGERGGLKALLESGGRCRSGTVIVGGADPLGDAPEGDETDEYGGGGEVSTEEVVVSIDLSSAVHDTEPLRRVPSGLVNRRRCLRTAWKSFESPFEAFQAVRSMEMGAAMRDSHLTRTTLRLPSF